MNNPFDMLKVIEQFIREIFDSIVSIMPSQTKILIIAKDHDIKSLLNQFTRIEVEDSKMNSKKGNYPFTI